MNPGETEVLGEKAYPSLRDIPEDVQVDVVDVFRRPVHAGDRAAGGRDRREDPVAAGGHRDQEAASIATQGGLTVIMGVCIRTSVNG